ncbi:TRAP transporter substrate-binding protein [Mesorhizobium sp. YIM 152430]|uniref:TRAP transporter substrate-binding protein n=1 Tax=Mesorhizobium sp. YIM 152430 TaxID=3031761 RepID=UPI0023DA4C6C|nr:TRAP transporter substrate-binding protein [Mesorhizobium sp. YIM 152430]MDF1600971.1 TRAP transporter substrate-binding protein [Mesorhizobium sp. YIM 152430]
MFNLKTLTAGAVAFAAFTSVAAAQETTLRLHQMLPPQATIPAEALRPWAAKVMEESGGRLKIEQYDAMQLGGTPPQLVDQVTDGVVDMIWTVIGYTPGRYPSTEAFELPFMVTTGEATSKAFHEYCEKYCMDEFAGVKVIAFHTHGPGLIHSKNPVDTLESMQGVKIRGGSRVINQMLEALGSTPIGMPVPAVSEALSKGVIDATTIPWEVTPSLRVPELVKNHTGFTGDEGLYTQTFVFAMNQASYDALPDEMKAVIDANSGIETAAMFGRVMDSGDEAGLKIAQDLGNNIITLDEAETQRWKDTAAPLIDAWIEEMNGRGMDANAMVDDARAMIAKHLGS